MDLGVTQKEAARRMGVDQWTVLNWEKCRTEPAQRFAPVILYFLGYDPHLAETADTQVTRSAATGSAKSQGFT